MAIVVPNFEVEDLVRGEEFNFKASVTVASASNANWTGAASLAFSDPTLTITGLTTGSTLGLLDSFESTTGDRVLLKDAGAASAGTAADDGFNGLWEVTGGTTTSLTLIRTFDLQVGDTFSRGMVTWIKNGTLHALTAWISTNTLVTITDATTNDITFTQFDVRDTLSILRGGTNSTSFTLNEIVIFDGTSLVSSGTLIAAVVIGTGTDDRIVRWDGTGVAVIQDSAATLTDAGALSGLTTISLSSDILDANGNELINFTTTGSAVNEISITNSATGVDAILGVSGESDRGMTINDSNGNELLQLVAVASAVNEVQITNAATGVNPTIQSEGEANTGLILADSNSNEVFILESVASAVNEVTLTNAATATNPSFTVTGGDTNVGLDFTTKGTGVFNFSASSATTPAEIRLLDDTGGEYIGLDVPSSVTSYTITFPAAVGSTGQILSATDGVGNLEWSTVATGRAFQIFALEAKAISPTYKTIAYFPWDDSQYGAAVTRTIILWAETGNRAMDVEVFDGTGQLGTVNVGTSTTGIATFTFSDPGGDDRLEIRVKKASGGGANPQIFGITMELT